MREPDEAEVVRRALAAVLSGDLESLREVVAEDLEWTYLNPMESDPTPITCRGRAELERSAGKWAELGLPVELEELRANGEQVLVVLHASGLDEVRARKAEDRNFHVVTVRDGLVRALRACRDRTEAVTLAGLPLA